MKDFEASSHGSIDVSGEILQATPITFTPDEQRKLLMLLRLEAPQVELLAFMRNSPHLMQNPDVRNFFDALFFNHSLMNLSESPRYASDFARKSLIDSIPSQIQGEIDRLEEKLALIKTQNPIQDPDQSERAARYCFILL